MMSLRSNVPEWNAGLNEAKKGEWEMKRGGLEAIRMTGSWATELSLIVTHCRAKESELFNECVCV